MPLNKQQEVFCQHYVLSRNGSESAKQAGYSTIAAANQASRLLKREDIKQRIEDLEGTFSTDIDVIKELEKQYTYANTQGHTNSAIKALELLSRVRGANSDVNTNLDSETLEGAIIGCLNVLGEDVVLGMLAKCDFANSLFSEEELEDLSTESLLESVTEGVVDPTYPEDTDSSVTSLEENT